MSRAPRSCSTTAAASASACSSRRAPRSTATREERPLPETDRRIYGPTTEKRWLYADSKAMDEFLALGYHQERELDCVIARLFNTVGPRQSGRYGMVIPRFVEKALTGEPLEIHGDGKQRAASATSRTRSARSKGLVDADGDSGESQRRLDGEAPRSRARPARAHARPAPTPRSCTSPMTRSTASASRTRCTESPRSRRSMPRSAGGPSGWLDEILADVISQARLPSEA